MLNKQDVCGLFVKPACVILIAIAATAPTNTTLYASPIVSYRDVLERAEEWRKYETLNLTVNGVVTGQKIVLWGFKDRDVGGTIIRTLVMGLNNDWPDAPAEAYGSANADSDYYWGLLPGETVDGFIGGIDGGVDGQGERNGRVGDWDSVNHKITFDAGEGLTPEMIQFAGFSPFALGSGPLTIDSVTISPEPATLGLLSLGGLGALLRRRRK